MDVLQFESTQTRAQALAKQIKSDINKLLRQKDMVTLAVSGQKSQREFLRALAEQPLDWSRVIIMLTDERVVASTNENSKSAFVLDILKQPETEKAVFWSYLNETSIDDENALQQYANKRFAQPDMVVLSPDMDDNSAAFWRESSQFETLLSAPAGIVFIESKAAPYKSLSLTLSAILTSKLIYVEISEKDYNELLSNAEENNNPQWPVSYVLNQSEVPVYVYTA